MKRKLALSAWALAWEVLTTHARLDEAFTSGAGSLRRMEQRRSVGQHARRILTAQLLLLGIRQEPDRRLLTLYWRDRNPPPGGSFVSKGRPARTSEGSQECFGTPWTAAIRRVRPLTPSLPYTCSKCFCTVRGLIPRLRAA